MRSRRRDQDLLLGLIDLAYGAAETPRLWENFLLSLAESVNGRGAVLLQHDLAASGAINIGVRLDPAGMGLYDRHFNRLDPWAAGASALGPGRVATDAMLVDRGELRQTEYFNDFAVRYDATRLLTVVLEQRRGVSSVLTVLRGEGDAPFEVDDRRVIAALIPHVRRALQVHQHLVFAQHEHAMATEALEALACAVFFVDADSQVILTNEKGRALLAAQDGLSIERGRLCAARRVQTQKLHSTCADVRHTRGVPRRSKGGALSIERPSGRPALQVIVAPPLTIEPLGTAGSHVAALAGVMSLLITIKSGPGPLR